MERLFKVLNESGTPFHGGIGKWYLPHDGHPGEWMPPIEGELVPCKNGYHLCREEDVVLWLGPAIFVPEYRGECIVHFDKLVVREARLLRRIDTWNERTARLLTCDWAERVLHIFEKEYPKDKRPREAINVARKYAVGEATKEELDAAGDAAWAAWATRDAARTAAYATRTAAWAIAWAARAARAAAGAIAWATRDAGAARAARAAGNAAGAARAAGDAAGAARKEERNWQTHRLLEYLDDKVK